MNVDDQIIYIYIIIINYSHHSLTDNYKQPKTKYEFEFEKIKN